MTDRRCCCFTPECIAFQDDFNRGDSTTVTGWTELSGDWEISGNRLTEAGNSGAIIRADAATFRPSEQHIQVEAINYTTGDIYRIYFDWVFGTTNRFYGQYEKLATGNQWRVSLHDSGGGVLDTEDMTVDVPGFPATLEACISGGFLNNDRAEIKADIAERDPSDVFPLKIVTPNLGKYTGLGNGAARAITYDNYLLSNPKTTNALCAFCFCFCETRPMLKTLTATFSGSLAWDCVDGLTVTLTYDKTVERWTGALTGIWDLELTCGNGLQPNGNAMCLELIPNGLDIDVDCCANFSGDADIADFCVASDPNNCAHDSNYDSTCEPLVLNYGPWSTVVSDLTCSPCKHDPPAPGAPGQFSIVVTE